MTVAARRGSCPVYPLCANPDQGGSGVDTGGYTMSYSRTKLFGAASITAMILLAGSMALAHPTGLTGTPDCGPSGSASAVPSESPSGAPSPAPAEQACPSGSSSGSPTGKPPYGHKSHKPKPTHRY